jgi:hypothetical protein
VSTKSEGKFGHSSTTPTGDKDTKDKPDQASTTPDVPPADAPGDNPQDQQTQPGTSDEPGSIGVPAQPQ